MTEAATRARLTRWTYGLYLGFWILALSIVFPPAPRLVWNASTSMPIGLYWVRPGAPVARGDTVIARTPKPYRRLAAERGYIPENVPLVKRVGGVAGDRICAAGSAVSINARTIATRRARDARGRLLPRWSGCRILGPGEYLLLMPDVADSFDGRYFGVTPQADIVGKAELLWAR